MNELEYIQSIRKEYSEYINNTPGLLSLLYDIDLLPEQCEHTELPVNATRMAAVVELYKLAYPEVPVDKNNSPVTLKMA